METSVRLSNPALAQKSKRKLKFTADLLIDKFLPISALPGT